MVTIVSGKVAGKDCMLLLSAKNLFNPNGRVFGSDVIKLFEQFKYDNDIGKFKLVKLLLEQSI